jgi:hypothetical protein
MSTNVLSIPDFVNLSHAEARQHYKALTVAGYLTEAAERADAYETAHKLSVRPTAAEIEAANRAAQFAPTMGASGSGHGFGWVLFTVGVVMIIAGFVMDGTVEGSSLYERVNNIGLMNVKTMLATAGSGFVVAGAIFAKR